MRKYDITVNNKKFTIDVKEFSTEAAVVEVDGKTFNVSIDNITQEGGKPVARKAVASKPAAAASAPAAAVPASGAGSVPAPIPGAILEVFVKVGDSVVAGQALLKMEAMKMENEIIAPSDGTVASISVAVGDSVTQGQELVSIG
ncbi:MAG: biotin carboxyl carrier protein [bacterium]|jgi:biotin carboxyl carrier protein